MKLLIVGKTGVFDTLAVAYGYLDRVDVNASPNFGNMELENSKTMVSAGKDQYRNEIFVVGYKEPEIIFRINQAFSALSDIDDPNRLQIMPLQIEGENLTLLLARLANLPLIGSLFLKWAKSRTINRSTHLYALGKNLNMEKHLDAKDNRNLILAAKPFKYGEKQ